jgi:tRNA nucleotidyltransferase (CCA-adding enzyme)
VPVYPEALYILYTLQQAGFDAYLVGGAVRDTILQAQSLEPVPGKYLNAHTDYDFTTNATPEQLLELFPDSFCENEFGTVSLAHEHVLEQMGATEIQFAAPEQVESTRLIDVSTATKLHRSLATSQHTQSDNSQPATSHADTSLAETPHTPHSSSQQHASIYKKTVYEITTYRSQEIYDDFRHPSHLEWGTTLSEDLTRRDFTINALAIAVAPKYLQTLAPSWFPESTLPLTEAERYHSVPAAAYTIIDEHDGLEDLAAGIIRTVGTARDRFAEDALRMLRTIRFSVQLNMQIAPATFDAISEQAALLQHISAERVRDEFLKMLASDFPKEAVLLLDEAGLLEYVLPELLPAKGVAQSGHHTTDVWVHSLDALEMCPSPDPIVRLATLLHDVGKPNTAQTSNGQHTFYNHEVVGARIAKSVAQRFKLSKRDVERMFLLVRHHMFHYQRENTDAAIRRFMRKIGMENIDDILDLREADRLGSGARKTSWRLEEMKERMKEQLHQPMDVSDLAVNGHDLMSELELQPGPILGRLLHQLFELVLEQPELNTREDLLQQAQNFYQELSK